MKKKILVLTSRYPYPVIGGDRLRIYNLCKELSRYYDLTLVSFCEELDEYESDMQDDGIFEKVKKVYLPRYRSYLNCLFAVFSKKPLQVAYYQSQKFQEAVDCEAADHDLILCHLIRTADYARSFKQRKVIEMTDAISLNYKRVKKNKELTGLRALIYALEERRVAAYENKVASEFDLCSFISDVDLHYVIPDIAGHKGSTIVCGNGVEISNFPYSFEPLNGSGTVRIVFIGAMKTLQNFDAAYWFGSKVVPILSRYVDVVFEVIGRIPDESARSLESLDCVTVLGGVESVSDAAKGAHIGVCPMRIGAGVQNKVLEYMALGLTCITTSIGLEGINATPGKEVLVADTPEQYAMAILSILEDDSEREVMAIAGRELIQKEYSWSFQLSDYVVEIDTLIG